MRARVIQWGTGLTGVHALRHILRHPELELVGVQVSTDQKEGKSAAEISGLQLDTPGAAVRATRDVAALIALDADAVCFMGSDKTVSDPRLPGTEAHHQVDMICRLLESGKHVSATTVVGMTHPPHYGRAVYDRIEAACAKGGTAQFTTGIEPGFATDLLPAMLTSMSGRIESMRAAQILYYKDYHHLPTFNAYGFGKYPDDPVTQSTTYSNRYINTWGVLPRMMADAVGISLDEIRQTIDIALAPEAFDLAVGRVEKGTIAGHWFQIQGIVNGRSRIIGEHISRLRHDIAPEWPRMADPLAQGFQVLIEGTPRMKLDLEMGERGEGGRTPMLDSMIGTACRAVNAIPYLVKCPPGAKSMFDMPLITGRGTFVHDRG